MKCLPPGNVFIAGARRHSAARRPVPAESREEIGRPCSRRCPTSSGGGAWSSRSSETVPSERSSSAWRTATRRVRRTHRGSAGRRRVPPDPRCVHHALSLGGLPPRCVDRSARLRRTSCGHRCPGNEEATEAMLSSCLPMIPVRSPKGWIGRSTHRMDRRASR